MRSRASSSRAAGPWTSAGPYTLNELWDVLISEQEAVSGEVIVSTSRRLLHEALWEFRRKNPTVDREWGLDLDAVKGHVKQMCVLIVHRAAAEKVLTNAQLSRRLPQTAKDDLNYIRTHFLSFASGQAEDLMTNTAYDVEQLLEMCRSYKHFASFPTDWYACIYR